jgi:hypothetical protein
LGEPLRVAFVLRVLRDEFALREPRLSGRKWKGDVADRRRVIRIDKLGNTSQRKGHLKEYLN